MVGRDKAVYAYPVEHLPLWNDELGTDFGPGTFGENLTTAGWLEDDVRIGDVWAWGEARLQVSQPRSPCYKLATVTGRPDLLKRFVRTGRTGWYLRVLQPATVPVAGPIQVIERDPAGISVLLAHRASLPGALDRSRGRSRGAGRCAGRRLAPLGAPPTRSGVNRLDTVRIRPLTPYQKQCYVFRRRIGQQSGQRRSVQVRCKRAWIARWR